MTSGLKKGNCAQKTTTTKNALNKYIQGSVASTTTLGQVGTSLNGRFFDPWLQIISADLYYTGKYVITVCMEMYRYKKPKYKT